jgi:hypothetical protein
MSDKPLSQRLMLKPGRSFHVFNPPPEHAGLLGPLPDGVSEVLGDAPVDILLAYFRSRGEMEANLSNFRPQLKPGGILWIAYYKGASRVKTDINRDSIAAYGQTLGLQPTAIISVNEDWAALRLKVTDG